MLITKCAVCRKPIASNDCLVATLQHAPPGKKGCSLTMTWLPVATLLPGAVALGSVECAECYLQGWAEAHMGPESEVRRVPVQ